MVLLRISNTIPPDDKPRQVGSIRKERCTIALGTFVAGAFTATYDPVGATAATDLGIQEQGYEIQIRHAKELIRETDQYGEMVIDAIFRGISDVFLQMSAIEWKAGPLLALFPYGAAVTPSGANYLGPGVIGRVDTAVAGAIILTAAADTPAATKPATLTAANCIVAENFEVSWAFNSKLRKMPGRFRVYPYDDTGTIKFYTAT